jgi:hypothetical protein
MMFWIWTALVAAVWYAVSPWMAANRDRKELTRKLRELLVELQKLNISLMPGS